MRIRDFIRDQFKKRLDAAGCLVVYDGERRYRDCVLALVGESCLVIDAGASISIASVMGNVRLASDISDSIARALNCRFVCLKEGKTVARVFQSSLDAAIRNIESHPRGKLFCRLIEFGPRTPDEPKAETSDGKTVLSDPECSEAIEFIFSHMVT